MVYQGFRNSLADLPMLCCLSSLVFVSECFSACFSACLRFLPLLNPLLRGAWIKGVLVSGFRDFVSGFRFGLGISRLHRLSCLVSSSYRLSRLGAQPPWEE